MNGTTGLHKLPSPAVPIQKRGKTLILPRFFDASPAVAGTKERMRGTRFSSNCVKFFDLYAKLRLIPTPPCRLAAASPLKEHKR